MGFVFLGIRKFFIVEVDSTVENMSYCAERHLRNAHDGHSDI